MDAKLVFVLSVFIHCCSGRYFNGRVFEHQPGIPLRDPVFLDEVCEDDPAYADGCQKYAAIEGYCKDQEDFMRKNCPMSCGYCLKESVKPPAPAVCEDDPAYADGCPGYAAIEGYCKDQEDFMRKNCPKSCGYCSEECKDDPEHEDSCKDIAKTAGFCEEQKEFTQKHCSLTCGWCEPPVTKAPIEEKPSPIPTTKPPSPPAFCRDRDVNCAKWKSLGLCDSQQAKMAVYCGVTCDICKAPTPDECYDKSDNCEDLKKAGFCASTVPTMEYEVKTNCLETCEFCVPDYP